jgi:hypothetical protein
VVVVVVVQKKPAGSDAGGFFIWCARFSELFVGRAMPAMNPLAASWRA